MKLLMRKLKTPTAGTSAQWIRLPSVRQQTQKTSLTAGASIERTRLPGARQQEPRIQTKYSQQLQLQLQLRHRRVVSQEVKAKLPQKC
jgi:hypothetical protein